MGDCIKSGGHATADQGKGGGISVKRIRLSSKTRPGLPVHSRSDPRLLTPKQWKRVLPPDSSGDGGEVGVPRNFFPRLVVG